MKTAKSPLSSRDITPEVAAKLRLKLKAGCLYISARLDIKPQGIVTSKLLYYKQNNAKLELHHGQAIKVIETYYYDSITYEPYLVQTVENLKKENTNNENMDTL